MSSVRGAGLRAAEVVSGPEAYDVERAWQADWLAERLGLDALDEGP